MWFSEARLARLESKLDNIQGLLLEVARSSRRNEWKETNIMATMSDLVAEVAAVKDVQASAAAAFQGLVAQLEAAKANADPAALDAVIADLKASTDALAAAVPANTEPAA